MKRTLCLVLIFSFVWTPLAAAAVRGKSVRYVGGTVPVFKAAINGTWELADTSVVFTAEKNGGKVSIPYDKVESLEYGQKVGRRLGAAMTGALLVNPLFLFMLFSKKRKHFLSIAYLDEEGKKQGAVFELGKGIVKESIMTLETKSGKKVEFESDEAKKHLAKQ